MSESVTKGGWARLRWIGAGLVGGLLAGGASGWAVGSDGFHGGGFMRGRHFMHRLHGGGPVDPEAAREHVKMGVSWALAYVDATPEQEQAWLAGGPVDWARESQALRGACYEVGDRKLSYRYIHDHWPTVQQRLLQAGIRLAGVLNRVFGP